MGDASTAAEPSTAGGSEQSMVNKDGGGGGGGGGMIILLILLVVGILAVVGVLFATGTLGGAKHETTAAECKYTSQLMAIFGWPFFKRFQKAHLVKMVEKGRRLRPHSEGCFRPPDSRSKRREALPLSSSEL
ncbi:uncharacterized protein LOC119458905 isoform X3 [Dermacentor silvarum]|uniref:uncharacterized protein LOC119458905 isoform X3 n=1 Tax=Dermacentor silvarum TaxID=543639 RepID=UPI002101C8BA|nr:uncharacterized protein LOC119458905 isoform X3 [Dermacentor silvarum]